MNRKMRANAAKQERRNASNGESKSKTFTPPTAYCGECGGTPVADLDLRNSKTGETIPLGTICQKSDKKDLN